MCLFYNRKGRKKVNGNKKPRKFFQLSGFYYTILLYLQIMANKVFHRPRAMNL